jgi:CBS domain-containing protein
LAGGRSELTASGGVAPARRSRFGGEGRQREGESATAETAIQEELSMRIQDAMTRDVRIASPAQPIRDAARLMAEIDAGVLPVGDNDRLVGMITDRDIALRAVAQGKGPDTPVREVMSTDVCYCFEDQEVDEVANNMADIKVRRLPVVNGDKRLVGIVSLGDIALSDGTDSAAATALCGVSEPGGEHCQSQDGAGMSSL